MKKIKSIVQIVLQDPTDLDSNSSPKTKERLYLHLLRDWNELINDRSEPESNLINNSIEFISSDLENYQPSYTEFSCAHCGAGLSLKKCNGCGNTFRDNYSRTGWDTPLSEKVVKFLQNNEHQFAIDPKIAQEQERLRWEEMNNR